MSKKNERKKRKRRGGRKCPTCEGSGRVLPTEDRTSTLCPTCFGLGKVKEAA